MSWDPHQLTNLHPNAPTETDQINAYTSGMKTLLGRPIEQVIHRLDALVLVLKTCTGDQCRWPWKQLHPDNTVHNLSAALEDKYDEFYENTHVRAKVGWQECYTGFGSGGADSTLYSVRSSSQFGT